jgi:hypothetical protein
MKKLFAFVALMGLGFAIVGCNPPETPKANTDGTTEAPAPTDSTTPPAYTEPPPADATTPPADGATPPADGAAPPADAAAPAGDAPAADAKTENP